MYAKAVPSRTTTQVATSVTSSESLNADQIIESPNALKSVLLQDALSLVAHYSLNESSRGILTAARPNDGHRDNHRRQPKSPNKPGGNESTHSEELSGLIN